LRPKETLQSRALQWLHEQHADDRLGDSENLSSVFPNGPDLSYEKLEFMVADSEGMLKFVFQFYLPTLSQFSS
jgi:hypothetical protein